MQEIEQRVAYAVKSIDDAINVLVLNGFEADPNIPRLSGIRAGLLLISGMPESEQIASYNSYISRLTGVAKNLAESPESPLRKTGVE